MKKIFQSLSLDKSPDRVSAQALSVYSLLKTRFDLPVN